MSDKVKFVVTVMVHSHGEASLDKDGNDLVFVHPPQMVPVVTIIGEHELDAEERARVQMMALHTILGHATVAATPKGMKQLDSMPINMMPPEGERS